LPSGVPAHTLWRLRVRGRVTASPAAGSSRESGERMGREVEDIEPGRSSDPFSSPYLDPAFVEEVVARDDVLARNAAITRGYHAISEAVAAVLGRTDANWPTFGQWASAEARRSIARDAVPRPLRPLLGEDVAEAVAGGNAAVFGDVAPLFIRFLEIARRRPDEPLGAGSAAVGRPGVTGAAATVFAEMEAFPPVAASADLRRAFRAYADVLELRDTQEQAAAKRRSERMLVANVSIGSHEQAVADPYVRAAIPGRSILAIAATAHLTIHVADGVLHRDRDVPPPAYLDGRQFPASLRDLADAEALGLAARFGQDPGSTRASDAPDWEDYDERMGFIFSFLRAYQQDPAIFHLPQGTPEA
jgi:hypothetical protein